MANWKKMGIKNTYTGNIGMLRNSVYAKNPLPAKKRKERKVYIQTIGTKQQLKDIFESMLQKPEQNVLVTEPKKFIFDPSTKLLEIREKYKDELKIHGEQTKIQEGFVYLIINEAYPGWIKAGMTIDYEQRLQVYNQYDPQSQFVYAKLKWVQDRRLLEKLLLEELKNRAQESQGEWFKIDIESASLLFE